MQGIALGRISFAAARRILDRRTCLSKRKAKRSNSPSDAATYRGSDKCLADAFRFTKGFILGASRVVKHSSRRSNAAELLSSGTRSVAPSARSSRLFADRRLELSLLSTSLMLTLLVSARALAFTDREPAVRRTG